MSAKADKENFLVAYPNGTSGSGLAPTWIAGACCGYPGFLTRFCCFCLGAGRAGLYGLRKNPWECHPEEPQATKDLRSSLKPQLRGFFASLRMTDWKRFSAACEAAAPVHRAGSGRGPKPSADRLLPTAYSRPAYLPTCLPAHCLPAHLPTCLPAYLPTCPTPLASTSKPGVWQAPSIAAHRSLRER